MATHSKESPLLHLSSPDCILCIKRDTHIQQLENVIVEQEKRNIGYEKIDAEKIAELREALECIKIIAENQDCPPLERIDLIVNTAKGALKWKR